MSIALSVYLQVLFSNIKIWDIAWLRQGFNEGPFLYLNAGAFVISPKHGPCVHATLSCNDITILHEIYSINRSEKKVSAQKSI